MMKKFLSLSTVLGMTFVLLLGLFIPAPLSVQSISPPPTIDGYLDQVYDQGIHTQVSSSNYPKVINDLYVLDDTAIDPGYVYVAYVINKDFVDNTYGANIVGQYLNPMGKPIGHGLDDLEESDRQHFEITNDCAETVLDFTADYFYLPDPPLSTLSGGDCWAFTSGEEDTGVWLGVPFTPTVCTSLAYNLNDTGYCAGGSCSAGGTNLLEDSPPQDNTPPDWYSGAYPDWIYEVIYEIRIDRDAFVTVGCPGGGLDTLGVGILHASPNKVGKPNAVTLLSFSTRSGLDAKLLPGLLLGLAGMIALGTVGSFWFRRYCPR